MALVPQFTNADIRQHLEESLRKIKQATLLRLARVGENFINNARGLGNYIDRTGNLRSSVGYVVLENGQEVNTGGLIASFKGKGSGQGKVVGKRVLSEVSKSYPTGLVLICVAGMDYAAAVEAKGRDVITGSSQLAITELKKSMDELRQKITRMK